VSTDQPASLPDDPATLQHLLLEAQAGITRLQVLNAVLPRNRFGRRSERLGEEALQQGIEDAEQSLGEQQAKIEAALPEAKRPENLPKRNGGALPEHLPRVEVVVDITDKTCACCGTPLHAIAEDRAEMLDYVPAQLRVQVIRRPRYGCRACEGVVVQAPAPERPIDGGMATEALRPTCWSASIPITCRCTSSRRSLPDRASSWIVPRCATGFEPVPQAADAKRWQARREGETCEPPWGAPAGGWSRCTSCS